EGSGETQDAVIPEIGDVQVPGHRIDGQAYGVREAFGANPQTAEILGSGLAEHQRWHTAILKRPRILPCQDPMIARICDVQVERPFASVQHHAIGTEQLGAKYHVYPVLS